MITNLDKIDMIKYLNTSINIYIDNINDKLEYDLHEEEEKYFIYLIDRNRIGIEMRDIEYIDNLITPKNKYNFEVIKGNSSGLLILDNINREYVNYQFYMCKNKGITFKIEDNYGGFKETTNENGEFSFDLKGYENLAHSFKSEDKFLFVYSLTNNTPIEKNYYEYNLLIKAMGHFSENQITLFFTPLFRDFNMTKYYIIVAKNDESNNIKNFSDPCYLENLMITNSDKIILRTITTSIAK